MNDKNQKAIAIYNIIAEDYAKKFDPIESDDDLIFPDTFLAHLKTGAHIVDLGCGTGFSAGYFTKYKMTVEGVDLSKSMIAIAKRNYPELTFSVADVRDFTPSHSADAVWAGYSLFHFEQIHLEQTLKQIKSYLDPGGILGIVMQEGEGEIEIEEPFLPEEKIYIHLYKEDQLRDILKEYSFEVIDVKSKRSADYEFSFNKILFIARLLPG